MHDIVLPAHGHRYLRRGERRRLQSWQVRESATDVCFVNTPDDWTLAISHYRLPRHAVTRRHPVLLCHGLGANRLTWDIAPDYSLPRWLLQQGFDVYSLELRGHGLSEKPGHPRRRWGWGVREYCELDLPTALDFVLARSGAPALHMVGHSMGGILLYARAALGDARLRSGITIASSLDYRDTPTVFRLIAPLAPLSHLVAQVPLHLPALLSSWASRFSARLIDASIACPRNVEPDIFRRYAANLLHPVSPRVLRDLAGLVNGRGLASTDGERYDALLQSRGYDFPILALAGTADTVCPPAAAARFGTQQRVFGKSEGQQEDYGHCDLVMGRNARDEVWPRIGEWLVRHDG